VLFVGHTDTRQPNGVFQPVRFKDDTWIFSPTHDDRLGLYVGLDYLLKAKLKFDILLTDDEEKHQSTALWFAPPKKYNWMFMFDRKGTGAVTYQYHTEQLKYKLGKYGFETSFGSYSCIRDLEHLGCAGINFGVGYQNNHSEQAYASMKDLKRQLSKFLDFFEEYQYLRMPHEEGYQRFAQAVNYHTWDWLKDKQESLMIGPKRKPEVKYGTADIIEADFIVIEEKEDIVKADEFDWPYTDFGDYLRDNKSVASVTPEGTLLMNENRFVSKLYQEVNKLKIPTHIPLILKNQFDIEMIIDLVQQSPWKLAMSEWLTAEDVDHIVVELINIGFGMPYNVQGFKTGRQYQQAYECGYKQRSKTILRTAKANKPESTNARLDRISKERKREGFYGDWKRDKQKKEEAIKAKKFIVLHPLPLPPEKEAEMFTTTRELIDSGYYVETHYICQHCKTDKIFDITKTDRLPELCGNCLTAGQKSLEQLDLFEASNSTGADVFTKILLRKRVNDETQFEFIGKENGRGADKYAWSKPGERTLEVKPPVGFTIEQSE